MEQQDTSNTNNSSFKPLNVSNLVRRPSFSPDPKLYSMEQSGNSVADASALTQELKYESISSKLGNGAGSGRPANANGQRTSITKFHATKRRDDEDDDEEEEDEEQNMGEPYDTNQPTDDDEPAENQNAAGQGQEEDGEQEEEEEEDEDDDEEAAKRARRSSANAQAASKDAAGKKYTQEARRKSIQGTAVMSPTESGPRRGSMKGSLNEGSNHDMHSLHRTVSDSSHLAKLSKIWHSFVQSILDSDAFHLYLRISSSIMFQIFSTEFILLGIIIGIGVLALNINQSKELPGIQYYNLINAVLGLLGKIAIFIGLVLSQFVAKGITANIMTKSMQGIPITGILHRYGRHDPERGRNVRRMFMVSLLSIEGCLWVLGYMMEWRDIASDIGRYPCVPATYPTTPAIPASLPSYLAGDTEFATIYQYGLPLGDGIVGGWSSWPLTAPAASFNVEGPGIAFAIGVSCADPILLTNDTASDDMKTRFTIYNEQMWNTTYNVAVGVRMPATSYTYDSFSDNDASTYDVLQQCELSLTVGKGYLTYTFVADEWGVVTGGTITSVRTGGSNGDGTGDKVVTLMPDAAKPMYFGRQADALSDTDTIYTNVTSWMASSIRLLFNDTAFGSSQGASFCNLLQWTTLPDGLYHPDVQYRGLSAMAGAAAHYILQQYDGSVISSCAYSAQVGYGIISAPNWASKLVIGILGINVFFQITLLFSWLLTSGGAQSHVDRAAWILDDPLRLLYDMRESLPKLTKGMRQQDHSMASLHQHMSKVIVRFGELKSTRGEKVGSLALDAPQNIVKMRKKREYK